MRSQPAVALVGAFDTKGPEYGFVRDRLAAGGVASVTIDVGVLGHPLLDADIPRDRVATAGGADLATLVAARDRNAGMVAMAAGAATIVRALLDEGRISGVLVLGGSNAAYVMARIGEAIPIGVPKLLASTSVGNDVAPYVGTTDLTMMYAVEDIAGLNSISAPLLARAADAIGGMVRGAPVEWGSATDGAVALTMFGITTAGATGIRERLADAGREVHVFHANGAGGRTLEALLRSGLFDAVVDLTTTELADDMFGGICSAGPDRLVAAGRRGIPQIVSVGALDVVNFGDHASVPERFRGRRLHAHNPEVTLMRTEPDDCARLGRLLAERVNATRGLAEVHVPVRGFSQLSVEGGPFHHPDADAALIVELRAHLDDRIPLRLHDLDINSPEFGLAVATAAERILTQERQEQ